MLRIALAMSCLLAVSAMQQTTCAAVYTLYPDSGSGIAGNTSTSAPGFGTESWQLAGNTKGELYIPATLLFGSSNPVTIDDLDSISFWTNKPGTAGDPDWTLYIYTKPTGTDDSPAGWYKSRLNSEPYFTQSTVAGNTWHEWSTDDATNPLRFYDQPRWGNFGTYPDPTLAQLQSGMYNSRDYGVEEILYISLQTGSSWSPGFAGLVDGLSVVVDGQTFDVNLEATPEPASLAIWGGIGVFGLVAARRRRKLAARQA